MFDFGVGIRARRRSGGGASPPPIWLPSVLGENLGGYFTGSRAVGSPVERIDDPFGRGRLPLLQPTAGSRPTITDGTMTFNSTSSRLITIPDTQTQTLPLAGAVNLPDGSGGDPGLGFTCTGLARASDGGWWVGNDGRNIETNPSAPFNGSLVRMSADFSTKTAEYTMASMGLDTSATGQSVQGIAIVPAAVAPSGVTEIWWVRSGGGSGSVHRCREDNGAYLGTAFGGATYTGLNGMSYDPDRDQVYVLMNSGTVRIEVHARAAVDFSAPIRTMTISGGGFADQVHFDRARQWVWYTEGANGSAGRLRARNIWNAPNSDHLVWTMTGADAIEGIAIDGSTIWVINDAYYHPGSPALNRVLRYDLPGNIPPGSRAYPTSDRIQFFGIMTVPALPAASTCIIGVGGDPLTGSTTGAAGLYVGTTAPRLLVAQNARTAIFSTPALSSEFLVYADINLATDRAEMWFNGASVGNLAFSASPTRNDLARTNVAIGNAPSGTRWFNGLIRAVGFSLGAAGAAERERIEGYMAHDVGRANLLPAAHPYKASPP